MKARKPYKQYVLSAIETIKQHIDNNPFYYKTSASLLELENGSIPHRQLVEKAFKEIYGVGIKEYQVKQRLEVAKKLMDEGLTIKQVAYKCLYKSQSSFAAAFKKVFHMTPTEWQMNYSE